MAWKAGERMESEDVKSACGLSAAGAGGRTGAVTTKPVPQNRQTPGAGP
jgi:hypothetical protein